jgi:predicted DsbA family dithiol-disulfide isomerase
MAAAMDADVDTCELFYQNKCASSDFECSDCIALEKELNNALAELDSANVLIKLLPKEVYTNSWDAKTSDVSTSPRSTSDKVDKNIADHNRWTVITSKGRRKGLTPKNLTELNTTYSLTTANRYEQLTNVQDTLAENITPKSQDENNILYTSNCDHRINLHHQRRE